MSTARLANQKKATEAFIDAWRRLSVDDMVALRTPDCIQETVPENSVHVPPQTNDQWLAALRPAFGLLTNFEVVVHSVTHDADAGRTVLHSDTFGDAAWGPYVNTHIMIFHWNEEGTHMSKIQDMLDSAEMQKRMAMIKEWQEKQGKA